MTTENPISGERFDSGTDLLLTLLEAKIKTGTISASEQLNYIRLLKESGHIWFKGGTCAKPLTDGVPFDDNAPIPFPISK